MTVFVTEPEGYSERALDCYSKIGPLVLGQISAGMRASVVLLVIRLGLQVTREFLDMFPGARAIASPTTGLGHIDLDVCRQRGVKVYSLSDCRDAISNVTSTSELALGLMIALLREIPAASRSVLVDNLWDRNLFRSRQLSRLTLGLVGLGRVGGHVAGYAQALGMRTLAYDPYQPDDRFKGLGVERCNLNDLLRLSDVVSLHAALTPETHHMIGQLEVDAMQPRAILINTARGGLVDEEVLALAIRDGRLAGVAADVLETEHGHEPWNSSPLVAVAREGHRVILTPHIGGCTTDAMHITEEALAEVVLADWVAK